MNGGMRRWKGYEMHQAKLDFLKCDRRGNNYKSLWSASISKKVHFDEKKNRRKKRKKS